MKHLYLLLAASFVFANCKSGQKMAAVLKGDDPLRTALRVRHADFDSVLARPNVYEVQILYTQIDRDEFQRPHFTTYSIGADSTRYFYPASVVKLPLALLALEKINYLNRNGYPRMSRETPYIIDSLRAFQQKVVARKGAPGGKPSIGQDIREIFAASDNEAYNHLFEFMGREEINRALREKGYLRTGIVHRFDFPGRANQWSSPIRFFSPEDGGTIFRQAEVEDKSAWKNPQANTKKGTGYLDSRDSLVRAPFDFSRKNWFSLYDMERMLRAVIFPEATPVEQQFDLTADDYQFLYKYMGGFPRECDHPTYEEAKYPDSYVKFLVFGDSKARQDGSVRSFNKVGEAYGTLTDVAYIVDFQHNVEFILAATILCNRDGVFNDNKYDYEATGYPFLAKLGRSLLEHERTRERKVKPDLSRFRR
ncbi:MAG: serine hydrolase [Saprospiraceae bacterium]